MPDNDDLWGAGIFQPEQFLDAIKWKDMPMPQARDAKGRFAPINFFRGEVIPKPEPDKIKTVADLSAKLVELRHAITTKHQNNYYQYGCIRFGAVETGGGPCFGSAGGFAKNANFFATHVFGNQGWAVSPRKEDKAWQDGPMLEYVHWVINDSCFAPVFITKDGADVIKNGAVFDPTKFSAQYIWNAACVIRDCTEYSYMIDTWYALQKLMDRNKALFFASLLQYDKTRGAFTPLMSAEGHHWFGSRINKDQLRQMVQRDIDPLGGNGEPLSVNASYYGMSQLFGKAGANWPVIAFPSGPGMKVVNTLGISGSMGAKTWAPHQIVDGMQKYMDLYGLKEKA